MGNLAKSTEKYIQEHPGIRECFRQGLINFSALSRKIALDMHLDVKNDFDAILIACRRYHTKLRKEPILGSKILDIMKSSKLEVKNKIVDLIVEKSVFFNHLIEIQKEVKQRQERLNIIEGTNTITIITSMEFLPFIQKLFKKKIIRVYENLAEVVFKSPENLTETPGFIAHISTLLADNGVNIIEVMSTYTDTLIVVNEKDIAKVMELL
ncbi:MAG: ACT domain-containing protein [Nanoarchaeota archaeon]|nr:ACT domain-containing protein [Nanoarchaeota archaeon]MBU1704740.1 ACT domain-containing protein [Nanoarchaeota archaeon]